MTDRVARAEQGSGLVGTERVRFSLDAIEEINPEPVRWHGRLSAGMAIPRGDTDSQDANVDFETTRRAEAHRIHLRAGYLGSREETDTSPASTSDRLYTAVARYDRFLTQKLFWLVGTDAERDGVADLDLRLITGPGLGYQFFERRDFEFYATLSLSWVHEDYEDDARDDDYAGGTLAWNLRRKLADSVDFFHRGKWVPSLKDFNDTQLLETETGIRTDLMKNWFFESRVRWNLNTEPSSGKERQDTRYIFGLGWGF